MVVKVGGHVTSFAHNVCIRECCRASAQPIRFGTPLTLHPFGANYQLSRGMRKSYEIFFKWLNSERGGICVGGVRHPADITLIDYYANSSIVSQIARYPINDLNISFLLAPYGTKLTEQLAIEANKSDTVVVAGAAATARVFENRPNVFGTLGAANKILLAALKLMSSMDKRPTRVAFIRENKSYTESTCRVLTDPDLEQKYGLTLVSENILPLNPSFNVVRQKVRLVKAAYADFLVGCVYGPVCRQIINASYMEDFNPKAMLMTICVTQESFLNDMQHLGQYIMGSTFWFPGLGSTSSLTKWTSQSFSLEYKRRFAQEDLPTYQAASTFASCSCSTARSSRRRPPWRRTPGG